MRIGQGPIHWSLVFQIWNSHLNILSIAFAIAALIVGLLAAHYWLKASKIEVDPGWRSGPHGFATDAQKPIEPADAQLSQMFWQTATMTAIVKSAYLNSVAARLTAVAVLLSALSGTLGALAGLLSPH